MSDDARITAALFPIPGMVAFPGTLAPLHVFEPRYRAMIKHCLDHDLWLAVSHTRKPLDTPPAKKRPSTITSLDELNTNLQSHESHEVFSAGPCQLLETTDDGRMHVAVQFTHRLQKVHSAQPVPFQIVSCAILPNRPPAFRDT